MHPEMVTLHCTIMRGGTSKGIFLLKNELPKNPDLRDKVIRAVFGSPDIRQIDGLGGADTLTSKLAIIGPPTRADADIDYTFAQVSIDTSKVDFKGNCGNISSAVGPFAIDKGFVQATEPITTVRIHQTNTGKIIIAEVPTKDGKALVEGNYEIDGVPGSGAKINLDFSDSAGSVTGKLLPTGNVKDKLDVPGLGKIEVSIVDAANPVVFVKAQDVGMKGTETPQEMDGDQDLLDRIERVRGKATEKIGLVNNWQEAATESPYIPFIVMVSPSASYETYNKKYIAAEEIDFVARLCFMLKTHKAYAITGTICTGVAAKIPGTVVYEVLKEDAKKRKELVFGHPAGKIDVEAEVEDNGSGYVIRRAAVGRTARMIMDGYVYIKKSIFG
ncbi:MAG: methylitaconate Delta-isomerase [Clostridia bacterium]|nr:methylitaconate Delta-isomerase [Clostridia bacterium]